MAMKRKSMPNCASTPKPSANRRRTLVLSSPQGGLKREPTEEDSLLLVNEDEAEKKAHRKSLALQSFQKTPAVLSSPTLSKKTTVMTPLSGPRLSADQLKQHYADCIKLSTENKINAKNAFGLHLLEYIDTILQEKSDNFQVVGCTIDAGAKIYAGRVDAVHSDILKMLGTMGSTEAEGEHERDDDEDGDIDDASRKKDKKKKKKITLCEGRTIEKNLANIRNTTYDLSFDVDPLIQITTRQSDEQSTAALISHNIFLKNDSLLFDSTSVYHTQTTLDSLPEPTIDTSHLASLIPGLLNSERVVCPTFDGFRFNNWICTEEKSFYKPPPSQPDTQESEQAEPFVPGMEDLADEDDFGVDAMSSCDEGEGGDHVARAPEKERMTIDELTLALEPTEFGYFNPQLTNMWAGPGHWKLKPILTKVDGEKKERKKKTHTTHLFDTPEDDLFKHFIKSRAKTTLADETIRSNRTSDNTLPLDIHYLESSLRKLSMMPLWRGKIAVTEKIVSSGEATDKDWYNYDNPHDLSNYCPNGPDDSDDDVGPAEISFGSQGDVNPTPIGDLQLIDAAPKIERIDIHYAKQAKKIDVRKLKKVMWSSIAPRPNEDVENIVKNKEVVLETGGEKLKNGLVNFSEVYKKIPYQVSATMSENLSVPIAFACLLHLANEHNLELKDGLDLSDIKIIAPSQ